MKRTKAQALDTRATILDAAEDVFFIYGVAHSTLDTIADAAGVTRGAIYWHFRNKEAVFEAVLERVGLSLDPFAVLIRLEDSNLLGRLQAELEARLAGALLDTRTRHLYCIVFARCGASEDTAGFCRRVRAANHNAELTIERVLRYAVAGKQLPPDLDVQEAALFIHATLTGILRKDLLRHRHNSKLDLSRIVRMTFLCLTQP